MYQMHINPLIAELNPICHLLALLGAHHIFHVSGLRVKTDRQGTGYGDMDAIGLAKEVFEWLAVLGTVMNI